MVRQSEEAMSQDCRRLNAEISLSGPSSIGGDDLQEVLKPGKTLQVTPDYDNHTAVFDRVRTGRRPSKGGDRRGAKLDSNT